MIYGIRSAEFIATAGRLLRRPPARLPALAAAHEGLTAWTVPEVWIAGGPAPNHYVDVTATFPRKIAALRAHQSQTGHLTGLEEQLRERLSVTAGRAGLGDGRLAEAFQRLDTG